MLDPLCVGFKPTIAYSHVAPSLVRRAPALSAQDVTPRWQAGYMEGSPKKKRQHYVPRLVLRNFSQDRASIRTLVLKTGEVYERASIRDQCSRDYFYGRDSGMEDAFAESETAVAAILKQVSYGDVRGFSGAYRASAVPETTAELETLRAHPLYILRQYVFYQANRTAAAADTMDDNYDEEIKYQLRKDPRFREEHPEAFDLLDKVTINPTNTIHHILHSAAAFSYGILDLTVKLLVSETPCFVLSDQPVVLRNQYAELSPEGADAPGALGTLARGLQMFMPVSPTMTIAVYDGDVYDCGSRDDIIVRMSARNAGLLNSMQARNAHECLYLHPSVTIDRDSLRRVWFGRPDMRPRRVEGPMRPSGDGMFKQYVYTLPPKIEPLPRLRCFQARKSLSPTIRGEFGDMVSFPIRSLALAQDVENIAALIDWKMKEEVIRRGLPVDLSSKEWLDSVEDPRVHPPRLEVIESD